LLLWNKKSNFASVNILIILNLYTMKTVKLIVAAAICAVLLGSCKSQLCPGYGNLSECEDQAVEQLA
jgi:hypothetical protein